MIMNDQPKKRILVTGADGFIGSHLTEQLVKDGHQVRAFVQYNSLNSWGWLDTLPTDVLSSIEIFPSDVRDSFHVEESAKGVDTIFHLAALIAIPFSYAAPESYVDTNIKGTLNVLQAARKESVSRVLVTSTSEVYGTAQYTPIDEKHPFQAQSPYSATKIGADRLTESFYRSFGVPATIVRPFNTYGPRQSARAVIPTIITQLLSGATSIRLGSTHPTRDLVFVRDTVSGFIAISNSQEALGQEINIATQRDISVGDLAALIIHKINPAATVELDQQRTRPEKSEVDQLLGSNAKITTMTNWKPAYTLEQGLDETIAWFKSDNNLARYKPNIYNL